VVVAVLGMLILLVAVELAVVVQVLLVLHNLLLEPLTVVVAEVAVDYHHQEQTQLVVTAVQE
jgi:hypothetical protein